MDRVRRSNERLDGLIPYDARNIPVEVFLSANENPEDVPAGIKKEIIEQLEALPFNRYPDPLAHDLREIIAQANGLEPGNVLLGNGGDEHLFNIFLAYGGPGRKFLNVPPTFSVYEANARLTGTEVVNIPRKADYSIDEEAVFERVAQGDIDLVIIASPNNPTGELAPETFLTQLLEATDALVLVDEAYFEFSRQTMRPYMMNHKNLLILRTFSKAFSLAGARMGYFLGDADVICEFLKVRQPYSVDALSQKVAEVVFKNRAQFERGMEAIIAARSVLFEKLSHMEGVLVYPSDSNYILFRVAEAHEVWQRLLDEHSVLIRDFSSSAYLKDCLRVTVGSEEENGRFLAALKNVLESR